MIHCKSKSMVTFSVPLGLKVQQALKGGGRSLTMLTRFWPLLTGYLLRFVKEFLYY